MKAPLGVAAVLAAHLPAPLFAQEAGDGWEPGNSTTAAVSPEVGGDDRSTGGNGVYGRFAGDVDFGAHAGAMVGSGVAGLVGLSAHYYSMAGVYTRYADAFDSRTLGTRRSLGMGVSLRPVFVPRWAMDAQSGAAVVDLTIDSIALGLGAYFADAGDSFGEERGFEASLGFGLPLMARAEGLWLDAQALMRWPDPDETSADPSVGALLSLSWHWMMSTRH